MLSVLSLYVIYTWRAQVVVYLLEQVSDGQELSLRGAFIDKFKTR